MMSRGDGKGTVVVKIGGSTIDTPGLLSELGESILRVSLDYWVVIVHGGGKDIGRQLGLLNKEYTFVQGMRVTDADTMKHVQMVLSGDVNKRIVNAFLEAGVRAAGFSGVDLGLIEARKMTVNGADIGFVGEVASVHTDLLEMCREKGIVPVISPVSRSGDGKIFNVNADVAAGEVAAALRADHVVYVSDVAGVMADSEVLHEIRCGKIQELVEKEVVTGGMVPKLRSASDVIARGAKRVHICGWNGTATLEKEFSPQSATGTVLYK